jgi:hypothetical protein
MTKHKKQNRKTGISKNPKHYGAGERQDNTLLAATIHGVGSNASSAGGIITGSVTMDPSAISGTDWADFSSTYDEFRVLGVKVHFVNAQPNNTIINQLVCIAFDNDTTSNPASFSAVQQYSTSSYFPAQWSTDKVITRTYWRPTRGVDTTIPWIDVANPSGSLGSVQFYSQGLTVSTAYLSLAIELYVEFRGRR